MIYIYTTLHDCRQYYRNIIRLLDYTDPLPLPCRLCALDVHVTVSLYPTTESQSQYEFVPGVTSANWGRSPDKSRLSLNPCTSNKLAQALN